MFLLYFFLINKEEVNEIKIKLWAFLGVQPCACNLDRDIRCLHGPGGSQFPGPHARGQELNTVGISLILLFCIQTTARLVMK